MGYAYGAVVFEKHFTLDRSMKGTDHSFSLEPSGLKKLVRDLGRAYVAKGDGIKDPKPGETKPLFKMGKKLVASKPLSSGICLTDEDIAIKSPNDGMAPYLKDDVIGKYLTRPVREDENIEQGWDDDGESE
jgi:N-acetylneuraminate synthase/sialic acid synthase